MFNNKEKDLCSTYKSIKESIINRGLKAIRSNYNFDSIKV